VVDFLSLSRLSESLSCYNKPFSWQPKLDDLPFDSICEVEAN
jgi:hypothetical protein